ncbi:MAG TPA: hypothetical protein VFQ60_01135 [Patescibacteria group bacterium]|nr:hypothetical protein [Patescibacteria group bacterium]
MPQEFTTFPKKRFETEKLPEITPKMREEWNKAIGADIIAKLPMYAPENLYAFWANETPAFQCGLSFEHYQGERTWKNAWEATLEGAKLVRETILKMWEARK